MANDAPVSARHRVCVSCNEAIAETDLLCPWCGAKQTPQERASAPVAAKPAVAPQPGVVRPPVRRPREEVFTPGARPTEITFLVIVLLVSSLITIIGILTKNDMMALQPTAFIKDTDHTFSEAAATVAVGGMAVTIFALVVKTALGVALWKMCRWARRAAIWTIIALFCIGTIFRFYVTFTMVSVVQDAMAAEQQEQKELVARATGNGGTPSLIPIPDGATRPHGDNPASDPAATTPDNAGEPGDAQTDRDVQPAPTAGLDPDAVYELAQKHSKPDVKGDLISGLMLGFGVIAVFGFLFTGFLLYLLRLEHVAQAYGDT